MDRRKLKRIKRRREAELKRKWFKVAGFGALPSPSELQCTFTAGSVTIDGKLIYDMETYSDA